MERNCCSKPKKWLKKCDFIKLDTLSFQALDFYLKQGFEVFGTIHNAGSYSHYYLTKELSQNS